MAWTSSLYSFSYPKSVSSHPLEKKSAPSKEEEDDSAGKVAK